MYATGLLFPLPIFVFTSPYAAVGGMTIAHGLRYLILMTLVALGGKLTTAGRRELLRLCVIGLVGGRRSASAPTFICRPRRRCGVCSACTQVSSARIFLVDARLWRLSRPLFARISRVPPNTFLTPATSGNLSRLPIDRLPI